MRRAAARWRDDVRHLVVSLVVAVAGYGLLVLVAVAVFASALGGLGLPLLRRALRLVHALADRQRAARGWPPVSRSRPRALGARAPSRRWVRP